MSDEHVRLALLQLKRSGWAHVVGEQAAQAVERELQGMTGWTKRCVAPAIYEFELTTAVDA